MSVLEGMAAYIRIVVLFAVGLSLTACGKQLEQPTVPSTTPTNPAAGLTVSPSSLAMTKIGERQTVTVNYSGGVSHCSTRFDNDGLVSIPSSTHTDVSLEIVVQAQDYGTGGVKVDCDASSIEVPVSVWPNGTWTGSVSWDGSCPGSDPAYKETAEVAVDATGKGTLTATDTPGFVRQYAILIPSGPATETFDSSGVFSYTPPIGNAFPVPGHVTVALLTDTLHYEETTSWGGCSNTYFGNLKRGG